MITTPSQAKAWLKSFRNRMDRIMKDDYKRQKERTEDYNRLRADRNKVWLMASLALYCKSNNTIDKRKIRRQAARDWQTSIELLSDIGYRNQ